MLVKIHSVAHLVNIQTRRAKGERRKSVSCRLRMEEDISIHKSDQSTLHKSMIY